MSSRSTITALPCSERGAGDGDEVLNLDAVARVR